MVKRIAGALALASVTALAAGCATIVHGTTQRVQIDSAPPGAEVAIDDSQHVMTPSAVDLARGKSHTLVFHKAGYQDATANLTSGFSGWVLGNLVVGGVVGMALDASDGAARKLSSDNVNVSLAPLPTSPKAAAASGDQARTASAPATQPALLLRDAQRAAQPQGAQSVVVPMRSEGPPPEDFIDDESGLTRPAAPAPASQ